MALGHEVIGLERGGDGLDPGLQAKTGTTRERRVGFDRLAREADAAEYPEALAYARELARQHFILRNESFGYPLNPARVAEIDAGKVTPYTPPRLY